LPLPVSHLRLSPNSMRVQKTQIEACHSPGQFGQLFEEISYWSNGLIKQLISDYQVSLERKFQGLGLRLILDQDFERMDALLTDHAAADFPPGPNPMFSPKYNRMTPDRCFWLGLETESGEPVSTVAAKKFDMLYDLGSRWASLRMHYDDESKTLPADQMIVDTKFPDGLEGTISITGRGWTRSDYRRRGLIRDLVVMARAECLSRWLIDWHLGGTTAQHLEHGREVSCFAYEAKQNVDYLGYYWKPAGFETTMHFHLLWMGPEEIMALVQREILRLDAGGAKTSAA